MARALLHVNDGRRRVINTDSIYYLKAVGGDTVVRRRDNGKDWEIKLDPTVNRILPVSRNYLRNLWTAFGQSK